MQQELIDKIIRKFAENNYPDVVIQKFYRWLTSPENKEEKENVLSEFWDSMQNDLNNTTLLELEKLHTRINEAPKKKNIHTVTLKTLRIAAAILLPVLCTFSIYQLYENNKLRNVELTECFVENGTNKEIILPDGTKVFINSGSSLIYPDKFTGDTRTVFLNGEANFFVKENKKQPFIVKTGYMSVQALGTTFNVQAYSDLPKSYATLEEGKILVETKSATAQKFILSPNEQIMYDHKTKEISRKVVDAKRFSSWKDGYLVFQSATFDEIVHALGKRYEVMFQYNPAEYEKRIFTVRFTPENTIDETLDIMQELIKGFKYKREENTVYIY